MCNGLEIPCTTTNYHVILGKLEFFKRIKNGNYSGIFTEDSDFELEYCWLHKGDEKYFLGFNTKKEAEDFCAQHAIDLEHTLCNFGDERINYQIVEE